MSASHYFSSKPLSKDKRGIIKTTLRGKPYEFLTSKGVFSAKRVDNGTRVLVENMVLPEKGDVLDIGCGIGIIGIVVAKENPDLQVYMTDVNPRAVKLSSINADKNLVKVAVREGDLYEPVEDFMFNTIISNPPISAGMKKVVFPLVQGAKDRLHPGGSLQLVIQTNKGGKMLGAYLDETFGEHSILARKSGYRVLVANKR